MAVEKYGKKFPTGTSKLDIELWCMRHDKREDYVGGRLSSFDHYRNAVDIIFNGKDSTRRHIWHEWDEYMIREAFGKREEKRFLGVAGASSAGKSDSYGLYAIMMYLSGPTETLCILTSTTVEMAKLRIWKSVREYWGQVEQYFSGIGRMTPGKAVHSKCVIRGVDVKGEISDTSGLRLVAADKQKGEDATSKVMGAKAPGKGFCLLIADELPDLAANLLTVAYTNLINNPIFQMIGLGNPNLKLDPFGKFCTPKDGWKSVEHEPMEWLTERGKVIRLDSESNPRVLEEDDWSEKDRETKQAKCFWMPDRSVINAAARDYGTKSRYYYRMYKAMWCSDKAPNAIYSESELLDASEQAPPKWDNPNQLTQVSGLDSAFTSGGDRSPNVSSLCGIVNGRKHLHFTSCEEVKIDDKKSLSPSHQVVQEWKLNCINKGIHPKCAGFDNSGAGIAFGHIVDMEWSPMVRKINFGGNPSGRILSLDGDTQMEFANRVSELWLQLKPYLRQGQITGLTQGMIEELVAREYDENQSGHKLKVEQKKKMKARTGKSPDIADSVVINVEVAIQNGLLDSIEQKTILSRANQRFNSAKRKIGSIRGTRKTKRLRF